METAGFSNVVSRYGILSAVVDLVENHRSQIG
jgi:hypothetical protein